MIWNNVFNTYGASWQRAIETNGPTQVKWQLTKLGSTVADVCVTVGVRVFLQTWHLDSWLKICTCTNREKIVKYFPVTFICNRKTWTSALAISCRRNKLLMTVLKSYWVVGLASQKLISKQISKCSRAGQEKSIQSKVWFVLIGKADFEISVYERETKKRRIPMGACSKFLFRHRCKSVRKKSLVPVFQI